MLHFCTYACSKAENRNKQFHILCLYDGALLCSICNLPMEENGQGLASISATAICGACDCGKSRDRKQIVRTKKKVANEPWSNLVAQWECVDRDEVKKLIHLIRHYPDQVKVNEVIAALDGMHTIKGPAYRPYKPEEIAISYFERKEVTV